MAVDFEKIFATNGNVRTLSDSQYLQGFSYLGSAPPPEEDFNYLLQNIDMKLKNLNDSKMDADTEVGVNLWKGETAHNVGDVRYPVTDTTGYKRLECVVAGTTGSAEPAWTGIGTHVTDGTVTWIVDNVRDGTPTGRTVLEHLSSPRAGYIKANGALISRESYPRLWAFANASGLIVTEAQWSAGQTGAFTAGDGATTFRIPDGRGVFERGWDDGRGIDKTILTGATTNGSNSITNISINTALLAIGMPVSGTGIPVGATIAGIVSANSITISANATATASEVALTITGRVLGGFEEQDVQPHLHPTGARAGTNPGSKADNPYATSDMGGSTGNTALSFGAETRPCNVAKLACIKY